MSIHQTRGVYGLKQAWNVSSFAGEPGPQIMW